MLNQDFSRRSALFGAAALAASVTSSTRAQTSSRKTFLFIHTATTAAGVGSWSPTFSNEKGTRMMRHRSPAIRTGGIC
jgi:hypothetical protein